MAKIFTRPVGGIPLEDEKIDEWFAQPTQGVLETLKRLEGDLLVLGVAGKMGVTTALMAKRGLEQLGRSNRVIGVSRFSNPAAREKLEKYGIETIPADLLNSEDLAKIPEVPNILYLAGQKFGTSDSPEVAWAMNAVLPAKVCERFQKSKIVAFSTGCVYPWASITGGGSTEDVELDTLGDYANSCVGRERVFTYYSKKNQTPVSLYRLNYAIDLRYGVLVDVATKVLAGEPVDVTMGHVNLIWQGDAIARAIQCLDHTAVPPAPINITGPETIPVRDLAHRFARIFGKEAQIVGEEVDKCWLSNAAKSFKLFGYPEVSLAEMIDWVAEYLQNGGVLLGKPTHFDSKNAKF